MSCLRSTTTQKSIRGHQSDGRGETASPVGLPVLGVSESGYYAWRDRPLSARAVRHAWLTDEIRRVHDESRDTYGALRVHAELTLGRGVVVGHCAVAMLMARANIAGLSGRPRYRRIPHEATEEDLVQRNFTVDRPNALWLTDITEHPTREGKVYCCVVLDAFSRRVVGWAIDRRCETALVNDALNMAGESRSTDAASVIHSDHGSQFTSWGFSEVVRKHRLLGSMGTVGDCYDCDDPLVLLRPA